MYQLVFLERTVNDEKFERKRWELLKKEGGLHKKRQEKKTGQESLTFYEEDGELVPTEETLEIMERESNAGRGKEILGFARQYKRGKVNVQAFGDRIVGMMNQIAYIAYALGNPKRMLSLRYFWCN